MDFLAYSDLKSHGWVGKKQGDASKEVGRS